MAKKHEIELIIEGLPEDDGQVRLGVFMSQLQHLAATVAKLDRDLHEGKSATAFRVTKLSYASPYRIVIEPAALPKNRYAGAAIIQSLGRITEALETESDLSGLDSDLLEDIRSLAKPIGKTVKSTTLIFNDHAFNLTPKIVSHVDEALAVDEECEGAITGMLDQINVHQGANVFHIYPEVGPKKVTCKFPARLFDDAVSAVGRRIEVFGTLNYRANVNFPHQITVTSIEAFPSESDLPDWDDLRGRAPNCTGELSSEAFVRELRDGWY